MTAPGTDHTRDVVVVGAGVIGLSIAWRLSQRGLQVTVVDPAPGRGASWAAAGMLAPVTEAHYGEEPLLAFNLTSHGLWASFAAELTAATGAPTGYRETGTVLVARDRDDREALDHLWAFQRELGLEVSRLSSREVRALEPGLAPTVVGGLHVAGDHQVDNRLLLPALQAAAVAAGADVVTGTVVEVASRSGRVTGVELGDGSRLGAPTVVLAAGHASSSIGGLPPRAVPVRPVKGQLLHLRGTREECPATRTVRGFDVYVVPRGDGRLVVGATVEERGADDRVTAGAVHDLLHEAYALLPGIDDLELVEVTAGLRPGTPDNAPLLGAAALDGLILATGHFRNGILLAPATAAAIADLVTTGAVPSTIAPFDPGRFALTGVAG